MIIKDRSVYLDYIHDLEKKVNNLCSGAYMLVLSDAQKKSVAEIRALIFSKAALMSMRAAAETGLIPNSDWICFKQEVNDLYVRLCNTVNRGGANITNRPSCTQNYTDDVFVEPLEQLHQSR